MDEKDLALFNEMLERVYNEAGEKADLTEEQKLAIEARKKLLDAGVSLSQNSTVTYLGTIEKDAYYYLPVPVIVTPPPGTHIEAIEVRLYFNPGENVTPLVHDIFPTQQFQDGLSIEGNLEIGISDVFEFASVVTGNPAVQLTKKMLEIASLDDLKISKKYSYLSRKPVIATSPPHADIAQWTLSSASLFQQEEHIEIAVILKMPLTLEHLTVGCEVSARKRNNSLRTLLLEDLKRLDGARKFIQEHFKQEGLDVLQSVKEYIENSYWNIKQTDLPAWKLDDDLEHTYD